MIARMAGRMWVHRLAGPLGDWVFVVAFSCFMGWAVLFVANEPSERFQGIGMILSLVIIFTVRVPRLRWAQSIGEPGGPADLPLWHRRMTPVVLPVGWVYLGAVLALGHWMAAILVGIGLFWGCTTLVTHRSEDGEDKSVVPTHLASRDQSSGWKPTSPVGASIPPPGWSQPPAWYPADGPRQGQSPDRE
jgi:hypothetical protein